MLETNHQQKTANPKEEKDFLAREEVRTMEKDLSKLREIEAGRERERVSHIKTEEEIVRERTRQEQAQQSALERDSAEKEAREREERVKRLREKRETEEGLLTERETARETSRTEQLRGTLKEIQSREDEVRKRFLARVEAKAEGRETPPVLSPFPPVSSAPALPGASIPEETVKEEIVPKITKPFIGKPSSSQKLLIRILLAVLAAAVLALLATFGYWYFVVRQAPPPPAAEETNKQELVIPPALFFVENSRRLPVSQADETPFLFFQALQEEMEQDSVSRILIEDTAQNEILGLKEFFDAFAITPPQGFYQSVENNPTLFVLAQAEGNRLGLAVKIRDSAELDEIMPIWEETMEQDLKELFELWSTGQPPLSAFFRDGRHDETDFRFQTFSRDDLGIVYALYGDYFVLTTSWKGMEKALDRLKEASLSFFISPDNGAEFVLENLTLREKIGQLFLVGINGTALSPSTEKLIKDIHPGGILLLKKNIGGETQTKNLISSLQQSSLSDSGIPLFIGVDQEGGTINSVNFSLEKTSQSAIRSPDQAYRVGLSRGEELRALGINLNLAPVLDEARPGDFLFDRVFPEDENSGALAKALIWGQKTAAILTAIKHFPGYGNIAFDPEDKLAVAAKTPEIALFKTAVEAKPEFVMISNMVYSEIDPELPFGFSPKGIGLLKESLGQEPLIITDDLPQPSLIEKFSLKGVVALPIRAGVDVLTFSTNWETTLQAAVDFLEEAVGNGELSEARINESVLKIIKLKKVYYNLSI